MKFIVLTNLTKRAAIGLALSGASLGLYGTVHAAEGQAQSETLSNVTVNSSGSASVEVSSEQTNTATVGGTNSDTGSASANTSELSLKSSADAITVTNDSNNSSLATSDKGRPATDGSIASANPEYAAVITNDLTNLGSDPAIVREAVETKVIQVARSIKDAQVAQSSRANLSAPTLSNPTAMPAGPAGQSEPAPSLPVTAAIQTLSNALSAVVLPTLALGLGAGLPVRAPLASLLLSIVVSAALYGLASLFVDRLRRSGYAHAARSDASVLLSFATPLEVSFAGSAVADKQDSLFSGVRNTNFLNNAIRKEVI